MRPLCIGTMRPPSHGLTCSQQLDLIQELPSIFQEWKFTFKYAYPMSKVYVIHSSFYSDDQSYHRVRDTLDVDNERDYKNMVTTLLMETPTKVRIIIDMKDVQKSCPVLVCAHCSLKTP